jgi:hypothetical protein
MKHRRPNHEKGGMMTAHLVFTPTGPILLLTSCSRVTDESLLEALASRGIHKFIAYEVPVESVHKLYGVPFEVVAEDIEQGNGMRVLDFNGPHILDTFDLEELGTPVAYEH